MRGYRSRYHSSLEPEKHVITGADIIGHLLKGVAGLLLDQPIILFFHIPCHRSVLYLTIDTGYTNILW